MEKALCSACLRTGEVIRCADVNAEFLIDAEECHRRGIQSLIAVPVYHDGGIAGGLELYYPATNAFTEQDVHTCQLMAGLVTEALARDEELTWKKSLASERAVMLEALEKLKPNLAALVNSRDPPRLRQRLASGATSVCRKCGHQLMGDEQFCGECGPPRSSDYEPPSMQSKVASMWHMQEAAKKKNEAVAPPNGASWSSKIHRRPPYGPSREVAGRFDRRADTRAFSAPELRADLSERRRCRRTQLANKSAKHAPPS